MLTMDDQVKVVDFGLATALDTDDSSKTANSPTLTFEATEDGVIPGTAAYMSPEQTQGRVADKRSGRVGFRLRAVRDADRSPLVREAECVRHARGGAPRRSQLDDAACHGSRRSSQLMRRCLEKDRAARIPDMAVVRFLLDEPTAVVPPFPGVQPSHVRKRLIAMSAAGLLGCVATGFVVWT